MCILARSVRPSGDFWDFAVRSLKTASALTGAVRREGHARARERGATPAGQVPVIRRSSQPPEPAVVLRTLADPMTEASRKDETGPRARSERQR
jgi:hypothetical protein